MSAPPRPWFERLFLLGYVAAVATVSLGLQVLHLLKVIP